MLSSKMPLSLQEPQKRELEVGDVTMADDLDCSIATDLPRKLGDIQQPQTSSVYI